MYGSNPKLEAMEAGPLISDAEIASSIKNTMNMLKTMSLPLSLLKGAPSYDPLGDAVRVRFLCLYREMSSLRPHSSSGTSPTSLPDIDLWMVGLQQEDAGAFAFGRAASLRRPFNSGAQVGFCQAALHGFCA